MCVEFEFGVVEMEVYGVFVDVYVVFDVWC